MMRPLPLSSLMLLLLGCAARSTGGQSGDDGDVKPAEPPLSCEPVETEIGWDAETPFGGSALDALSRLSPSVSLQLYWVPFDGVPGTTFSPGPGPTSLALGIGMRTDASVKHVTWRANWPEATCPDEVLQLPVQVQLASADGAMALQVAGMLELASGSSGHLSAELPADIGGSFRFEQIGSDPHWSSEGFQLWAELWPGGSQGSIIPSFAFDDSDSPAPEPHSPPPSPRPQLASSPQPAVPEHWSAIAVWPRLESCHDGAITEDYLPDDRVIGVSIADLVSDLDSRSDWTLISGERVLPVQFKFAAPTGLQCAHKAGRSISFDVAASLRATAATGAPLEHLAATSIFQLTATSTLDGTALERLHWVRRDLVLPQSRAEFEAGTGIALDASEQYQQIWWSWHGTQSRTGPAQPWSTSGALLVNSLNAQQAAEVARVQAQGGPGPEFSFDESTQSLVLPGDVLLHAEIQQP